MVQSRVERYNNLDLLAFHYPHYESPFRVLINPNFSRWMERYCAEWAINNSGPMRNNEKYCRSIRNADIGIFSAITFPTANWHRMEKLVKWASMFFIADDYHDIVTQMSKQSASADGIDCDYFWQHLIEMFDQAERGDWSHK